MITFFFFLSLCHVSVTSFSSRSFLSSHQHPPHLRNSKRCQFHSRNHRLSASTKDSFSSSRIQYYNHDGWNLAYRHKPSRRLISSTPALILIHPVGIGLSSWFWEKFLSSWDGDGDVYAPDLIGCGELGDSWDPATRGLFFPLSWVEGCETLIRQINKPCIIIVQGGLAPVGVMLAARNKSSLIKGLVLTSPPIWKEMIHPIPPSELKRNYDFLTSPTFGPIAFNVLERRSVIRFFSDLFLFETKCDDEWVDLAQEGCTVEARQPVMAFNAGLLNHRSFEEELRSIRQPTLILAGREDVGRQRRREEYGMEMEFCRLMTLPGQNVLPWESPGETCDVVLEFCKELRGNWKLTL